MATRVQVAAQRIWVSYSSVYAWRKQFEVAFASLTAGQSYTLVITTFDNFQTGTVTLATTSPEPASIALVGAGLAGAALWRRRRV